MEDNCDSAFMAGTHAPSNQSDLRKESHSTQLLLVLPGLPWPKLLIFDPRISTSMSRGMHVRDNVLRQLDKIRHSILSLALQNPICGYDENMACSILRRQRDKSSLS